MKIEPQNAASLGTFAVTNEKNQINEEELYQAIIRSQLSSVGGGQALKVYDGAVEKLKVSMVRPDGRFQLEDVANKALDELVKSRSVTSDTAEKIRSQAFAAAQLDEDPSKLYDSIGGPNDPTRAVAPLADGIKKAEEELKAFASGKAVPSMPVSSASSASTKGSTVKLGGGANGFLFKPVSSHDGKLSVLLPGSISRQAAKVVLKDSDGKVIETGHFTSFGDTGTRAKFAFSKPGGAYPKNLTVEIQLRDGSVKSISISDPSKRYE